MVWSFAMQGCRFVCKIEKQFTLQDTYSSFHLSLVLTVQCFQVLVVNHTGHNLVSVQSRIKFVVWRWVFLSNHSPKGQEHDDDDGEDHLDVWPGWEAKEAHHAELHHLTERKEVNLALWTSPDVVIGRVGGLITCPPRKRSLSGVLSWSELRLPVP